MDAQPKFVRPAATARRRDRTGDGSLPAVTLHQILADQALPEILGRPDGPNKPVWGERELAAYRLGSVGPDLGYFPGGDRFLSDLAHTVQTTDLTRALLRGARSTVQRAFALGWLVHVLADERIHPLVGLAVGEARTGDRGRFFPSYADPGTHLRVEMGLDAFYAKRHPAARGRLIPFTLDEGDAAFVSEVYESVYGLAFEVEHVQAGLRGCARLGSGCSVAAWGFSAYISQAATDTPPRVSRPDPQRRGALTMAFLKPLRPQRWLTSLVTPIVESFAEIVRRERVGLSARANVNLDTGRLETAERDHRVALEARCTLRRRLDDAVTPATVPFPGQLDEVASSEASERSA